MSEHTPTPWDVADYCLRGIRGCATDEQYQEAHERVMKLATKMEEMKKSRYPADVLTRHCQSCGKVISNHCFVCEKDWQS